MLQETYFIDYALGKLVGQELQKLGVNVEFHKDNFSSACPDLEWLPAVSQKGWIILTKDARISRNLLELQAITQSKARIFILVYGNMKGSEMSSIFINSIEKIEKLAKANPAPFIAKIYKNSQVKLYKNSQALKIYL